ncbi:hypothetical protein ISN45_Aa08g015370 [Arabidopsis thaliana x Arabidopsis arenosa]|uniref:Uncharacterized protein n=1 Tax=Arabidopsis thaliana x Arabidopsis arenosa TaxID=1240361 RepID=A0A8T1XMX1_9BRAS|nr:hypothetical protein ISN45_Aa08g015370 [Arabidopsis thaliana x Arabidopsis arenosa]KAG7533949.1 hypothetical protein ISN45_Aa08g015370 [Arabidopsis thaliana x Arabidopsis arenosa]
MKSNNVAELPWKKVAKGSRSSTRRSKKPVVRVPASGIEAEAKSSTGTVAGKPMPEKLGVSVLGQHFAERVEHVPIKKRRFIVRSPSPSKRPSAQREDSEHKVQINLALPVSRLNPNLISDVRDEKPDYSGHDFSGIKILADAACSTDVSNDFALAVDRLPAEESVVQQQDTSTISTHVEGNDSSAGTADVSHTAVDSGDQTGQGKSNIVAPQKYPLTNLCKELADEQSVEHSRVTSGGMIAPKLTSIALSNDSSTERSKANVEASESETLAPDSGAVTVSEKSSADEPTEKNSEGLKDIKFHWDLNFPCDVEDEASGRDIEGEITESIAPKESERFDGSKDSMDGVIASDEHTKFSSPSGPNTEAAATNDKEGQSGYDSQFEDGELREPYPWEEIGEVQQLDYGSEPENEIFYSMDSEKGILADKNFRHVKCESGDALRIGQANEGSDIEKQVVVNMSDSHPKKGSSSPSRSFGSKPYKEVPSHDAIQRRRPEEVSTGPDRFVGRDDRSGMRMRNRSPRRGYFNGWDSKRRFSPPNYKEGSYGSGRPWPKRMADDRGMMNNGFDDSGAGPGPGQEPDGYVHRQFSNGGYRGRFKRFPDGGDRKFRGPHSDTNQFPGRMHNRMSGNRRERGGSPVLRRLHYPQSESRSRSRSPVSWNSRNRSSPPPPGGLRADERTTERVRLPFQKRFPADQEMGYMSPPRNRMSSPRFFEGRNNDTGENHNSFRERKFWPGQRFGENHNNFRERKFRPGQRFDVGNSMRRPNSDNNNLRPFIRNRRFEGTEENTGGNRFEMAQQRRTRRSEATEDGGDDIRRFKFNEEQPVVVANNDNNNNKKS